MSRYDGLIIPRSYSEYINKTDAATLQQALQLSGVMDAAPTANSLKPVQSGGVYNFLNTLFNDEIYELNMSWSAGALGSRGVQEQIDVSKTGYTPISWSIIYITDSSKVNLLLFGANSKTRLVINAYRATSNAESITIRVLVTYRKNT